MTTIVDLRSLNAESQAAQLLVDGFATHWPNAWPTLADAQAEVRELCGDTEIIVLAAVDASGAVIGWGGSLPEYDAHTWELHPLVVRDDQRGRGVGRALVQALEAAVIARGGLNMMLGTDDEDHMTSLSGVDLYPNPWVHIQSIQNLKNHPFTFYERLGYHIVGVVPDANGIGKPDILMAKRLRQP